MANHTNSDDWSLYPYDPVKAPPIIFAVLLTLVGAYQVYQSFIKYHWKKFGGTMLWATSVWVAGFICRSISVYHVRSVNIYIAQFVLIFVGPPLYAAAEFFILGRLLAYLPYFAPIHPGRVLSTFLFLSALVESLTANGAANSAGSGRTHSQIQSGLMCIKVALILQCFVEALFMSLVAQTEVRCRRAKKFPRHIRPVFYVLYVTSAMMMLRCIVRTIEGFQLSRCDSGGGNSQCGAVSTNEWYLWVFEIANITLFVILLAIFHPGRYLPRSSKIFLDPVDMTTERLGLGYGSADKRPFWLTCVDPFNLRGILTGKGMSTEKFWEVEQPVYNGEDLRKTKNYATVEGKEAFALKENGTTTQA